MEIREKTIKAMEKLDSDQLMELYEIVLSMENQERNDSKPSCSGYMAVRQASSRIKGSLIKINIDRFQELRGISPKCR